MKRDAYARAGVDLRRVKRIHRGVARALASTFSTRAGRFGSPLMGIGHYAGVIDIGHGQALTMHTDGVGTKVLVALQMERFDTVGIDCIAMTVNDLVCLGSEPIALLDYVAVEHEDESLISELAVGLVAGAKRANAAIVGGETAIMENVKGFDLVSMGVGVVQKERILDGASIRVGDSVIGVASSGLHSNGYTLARKVLLGKHSLEEEVPELGGTLGEALLEPTTIYVKPTLEAIRSCDVHGIGHITGGAFAKLTRLVGRRDLGFVLEPPARPPVFRMIQEEGHLSDREMYSTFNMGVGLCLCTPRSDEEGVVRAFRRSGLRAFRVGSVRRGHGVRIGSIRL